MHEGKLLAFVSSDNDRCGLTGRKIVVWFKIGNSFRIKVERKSVKDLLTNRMKSKTTTHGLFYQEFGDEIFLFLDGIGGRISKKMIFTGLII